MYTHKNANASTISLDMFSVVNDDARMNWRKPIDDLRERGYTLAKIAEECGFASRGHVHTVANDPGRDVAWTIGDTLLRLHKRVMRRKAKR